MGFASICIISVSKQKKRIENKFLKNHLRHVSQSILKLLVCTSILPMFDPPRNLSREREQETL